MAAYFLCMPPDKFPRPNSKVLLDGEEIGTVTSAVDDDITIGDETIRWKHVNMDICDENTAKILEVLHRMGLLIDAVRYGKDTDILCFYREVQ